MITMKILILIAVFQVLFSCQVFAQKKPTRDRSKEVPANVVVVKTSPQGSTPKPKTTVPKATSSSAKNTTKISTSSTTGANTTKQRTQNSRNTNFRVSLNKLEFKSSVETKSITVYSGSSWSISTRPAGWVSVIRSGNTIRLRVDANTATNVRSSYLILACGNERRRIDITQQGVTPYLIVSKDFASFYSSGGSESFTVSSNGRWEITTKPYWVDYSIIGNALKIFVEANTSTSDRTGYFVIKCGNIEKQVNISQAGKSTHTYSNNSDYSSNYNTYSHRNTKTDTNTNTNWWKGRVRCGLNLLAFDINKYNMSLKTGFRIRFGKYTDWFNIVSGCNYSWQRVGNIDIYTERYTNYFEIFIPIEFRLNCIKLGDFGRLYVGTGFDLGFWTTTGSFSLSYAINPMIGIMTKHLDIGVDTRIYLKDPALNDYKTRFGVFANWYF